MALEIIQLGMDTRDVIARFEQEREALALMDHPNDSKGLDAGATETRRHRLTVPERLEIMWSVRAS